MLKRLFLAITLLSACVAYSQYSIFGKIENKETGRLEFVTVALMKDSLVLKTIYSDSLGQYNYLNLPPDNYILLFSLVGYEQKTIRLDLQKDTVLTTLLTGSLSQLKEVVITGKTPLIERKVDRLIFNVENHVAIAGSDAIDVLKITPKLKVQNDKIAMIGKSGMAVMIDDKIVQLSGEELVGFLKSIPADNIKSIEVISTPPAQYDAEGNSGLINIKLKQSKKNQWNVSVRASYLQSTYPKGSGGGSFDYQKNKTSVYSTVNYINGASAPTETNKIYYPNGLWNKINQRKDITNVFYARMGADYKITNGWSAGIQYLSSVSNPAIKENITTSIYNPSNTLVTSYINTVANNVIKNNSHSLNLNSAVRLDTSGKKATINWNYFTYTSDDNRNFETISILSANNTSLQEIKNYSGMIDFEHPMKGLDLKYGGKVSFITTQNKVNYFNTNTGFPVFDPAQSNQFIYEENTQAAYTSATKKINEKCEAQLGLRVENTQTKGNSITLNQTNENHYAQLFPTFYLSYEANEKHSFSLSYNKRIERPPYYRLNPFRWYNNPYSYSEGNPFLQPSFSHNVECNYTFNEDLTTNVYVSNTRKGFGQVPIIDIQSNIERIIVENYYTTTIVGLTESYSFRTGEWLLSTLSLDWNYSQSKALLSFTNPFLNSSNAYMYLSNDVVLNKNKTLLLNIFAWYNFKGASDLDRNNAYSQLDASLKYLARNKKLQIGISGEDILSSNRPVYTGFTNHTQVEYKNYYDNRLLRISLLYKFGNKNIDVEKKDFGNESEKQRAN